MTSPNGQIPPGSAQTGSGDAAGFASFAAKTGDQWKAEANGQFASSYEGPFGFLGKLVTNMLGGFANGITGLVSSLFSGLTGLSGGSLLDLIGSLVGIKSQAQLAKEASDSAASQAQGALTAAQAADRKITALLAGGVRTVYTSNATWTKPAGLVKLGVLLYGGGRQGNGANFNSPGGDGGGVIFYEFKAEDLPASVPITIGAGQPSSASADTKFGNLLTSAVVGGGSLSNSTLLALSPSVFGGKGGTSGPSINGSGGFGQSGASTALASGGGPNGGAGGNAPVTGQYLAGGGGGGGGQSSNAFAGAATNGGAGGFPSGGGGGAGRNGNESYWVGGYGAPGLCALIEYTEAA